MVEHAPGECSDQRAQHIKYNALPAETPHGLKHTFKVVHKLNSLGSARQRLTTEAPIANSIQRSALDIDDAQLSLRIQPFALLNELRVDVDARITAVPTFAAQKIKKITIAAADIDNRVRRLQAVDLSQKIKVKRLSSLRFSKRRCAMP